MNKETEDISPLGTSFEALSKTQRTMTQTATVEETRLQVREIRVGPWSGGVSIRPRNSFPRWNLIVAKDGSVHSFEEQKEGKIGYLTGVTGPLELFVGSARFPACPLQEGWHEGGPDVRPLWNV